MKLKQQLDICSMKPHTPPVVVPTYEKLFDSKYRQLFNILATVGAKYLFILNKSHSFMMKKFDK